ncbi:phytanoyl-CoA dioxygenase family protein [Rubripirellula sp.]|nr:phytanoyl-CoA dioxygenase family protein [Rubripirellula sp.]MDB4644883.1 phytanoyl-CoA dioxygenase family protein [Rubripirellula sp.]
MAHSHQQHLRESFQQDGYVQLTAFVDEPTINEVDQQLQRFIDTTVPTMPADHVFYENKQDPTTLKQIQHLETHDSWFHSLFTDSPFRRIAETLLGGACIPMNLQYFNKPPKLSKATPPHQDAYYFMITPCEAVTMWLALDEVDDGNGCIRYLVGSHLGDLIPHEQTATLGFSQGIADYFRHCDTRKERPLHAARGDLLAHHALTVHRAEANASETRQRRAIGFIYYSAEAEQDSVAHAAYQERLKQRMAATNRI